MDKKKSFKGSSKLAAPFAAFERDFPKGGKAMKVAAEQVPSKAEKALVGGMKKKAIGKTLGKAALGGALGLGAGVVLDMALDSKDAGDAKADKTMSERAKYGDVAKNLPKNLPANLKGSPKMIDMDDSPSYIPRPKGKSPEDVARGFIQERKRNIPVTSVTQTEDNPDYAKYEVRKGKGSKLSTNEAAAVGDSVARKVKSPSRYREK